MSEQLRSIEWSSSEDISEVWLNCIERYEITDFMRLFESIYNMLYEIKYSSL